MHGNVGAIGDVQMHDRSEPGGVGVSAHAAVVQEGSWVMTAPASCDGRESGWRVEWIDRIAQGRSDTRDVVVSNRDAW